MPGKTPAISGPGFFKHGVGTFEKNMLILNNSEYLFNIIICHWRKCTFTFSPRVVYTFTDLSTWKWGRLYQRSCVLSQEDSCTRQSWGRPITRMGTARSGVAILVYKTGSHSGPRGRLGHHRSWPNPGLQAELENLEYLLVRWCNCPFTLIWLIYLNTLKYNSFWGLWGKMVLNVKCSPPNRKAE